MNKNKCKIARKDTCEVEMSIHPVPTLSCVNLRSQNFVFNVLISCQGRLKQQRNRVGACLETIQTNQLERPLSKFR